MAHTEITPQKKQAFMTVLFAVLSYNFKRPNRSSEEAGMVLVNNPDVAEALASHRFPLDGVTEAFQPLPPVPSRLFLMLVHPDDF